MRFWVQVLCGGFLAAVSAAPAYADFTKIDFVYTSIAHLGVSGSMTEVPFDVPTAVDMVGDFLRSGGSTINKISQDRIRLFQTEADKVCERWVHSIYRQEWAAYDGNKFKDYKNIKRAGPPECDIPKPSWLHYGYTAEKMNESSGDGYVVYAWLDRSVSRTQAIMRPSFSSLFGTRYSLDMWSRVPANVTTTLPFETQLVVFVWRGAEDQKTHIAAIGIPKSGSVEPSPGASVGYALRALADGRIEAAAVQNLLSYMVQKSLTVSSAAGTKPQDD